MPVIAFSFQIVSAMMSMLNSSGNSVQTCFGPDLGGKHTSAFHEVRADLRAEVCAFGYIKEVPIHSYLTELLTIRNVCWIWLRVLSA